MSSRMRNAYIDQQTFRGRYESMLTQYSLMQTQNEELKSELLRCKGQQQRLPATTKALNAAQLTICDLRTALTSSEEQAKETSQAREQASRMQELLAKAENDMAIMTAKLKRHQETEDAAATELAGCRAQLLGTSEELASKSKAFETVKAKLEGLVAQTSECKRLSARNAWLVQQALKKAAGQARRRRIVRALPAWAAVCVRTRDLAVRCGLERRRRRWRTLRVLCAAWRERTAECYHQERVLSALDAKFRRGRLHAAFEALVDARRIDATLNWYVKMDGLRRWSAVVAAAGKARSRLQVMLLFSLDRIKRFCSPREPRPLKLIRGRRWLRKSFDEGLDQRECAPWTAFQARCSSSCAS